MKRPLAVNAQTAFEIRGNCLGRPDKGRGLFGHVIGNVSVYKEIPALCSTCQEDSGNLRGGLRKLTHRAMKHTAQQATSFQLAVKE
jgi:hypothetical protein